MFRSARLEENNSINQEQILSFLESLNNQNNTIKMRNFEEKHKQQLIHEALQYKNAKESLIKQSALQNYLSKKEVILPNPKMHRKLNDYYYVPDFTEKNYDPNTDDLTEPPIQDPPGSNPCLAYQSDDPNKCLVCDKDRHYYPVLRNYSHILCGYFKQGVSRQCNLRIEHYPNERDIIDLQNKWRETRFRDAWTLKNVTLPNGTLASYCSHKYFYFLTNDLYEICSNEDIVLKPIEQSLVSIYSNLTKQFGCFDCSKPHWETQTLLYYPQFDLSVGICLSNSTGCKVNQYFDSVVHKCKNCEDQYPNCAFCNQNECLICFDGFYLHPQVYDYSNGANRSLCVFDVCPLNTCKDPIVKKCYPSKLQDCVICVQNENKQQSCEYCRPPFILNYDETTKIQQCADKVATNTHKYTLNEKGERVYNRFALGSKAVTFTDDPPGWGFFPPGLMDAGESLFSPLVMFQTGLLNFADSIQNYEALTLKSNLIIYLGKGDYFFYYCTKENQRFTSASEADELYTYCWVLMYWTWLQNDNTEITIQAMECSMKEEIRKIHDLSSQENQREFNEIFDSQCVDLTTNTDDRPLVYVNDPNSFFNVTSKLTIKNIRFTGINQMVVSSSAKNFGSLAKVLCEVDNENQNGEILQLKKPSGRNILFNYECKDKFYDAPTFPPVDGKSSEQCIKNEFKQFSSIKSSTLGCSGSLNDENYHKLDSSMLLPLFRRRALFNLYAFSEFQSRREGPPELVIINCDFEYFLNDYESLIYVETQTYWKFQGQIQVANDDKYKYYDESLPYFNNQTKDFYAANGMDRGAKITIVDSNFRQSRFCKGLISYRPSYFENQMRSFTNYTHIFMTNPNKQDNGSQIIIKNSKFISLNAFTKVSALAAYGGINPSITIDKDVLYTFKVPAFIHKGIVLNIEGFNGRVEIIDCEFEKNMHFIPDIYYKFQSSQATGNHLAFFDTLATSEYQVRKCLPDEGKDDFFFGKGFSQDDDLDSFFDRFEKLGVIYISRNSKEIIIRGNTFKSNIGTFGGAITINSPNWNKGEPYVVIKNNRFSGNMAYFSGNALYIRNILPSSKVSTLNCGGVDIEGNTFENNIGMKIHNGGAISAVCEYLTDSKHDDFQTSQNQDVTEILQEVINDGQNNVSLISYTTLTPLQIKKQELTIKNNEFVENFSGMKGTALYIKQFTNVVIESCLFIKNWPVYSAIELQYSPYAQYLSRGQAITFRDELCPEEFQYLEKCNNIQNEIILWSRVKGAIFIEFCQEENCLNNVRSQQLTISNSKFNKNDAGPFLDINLQNQNSDPLASQIFIKGGLLNFIQNCQFQDNAMKGETYFPSLIKSKLTALFPKEYFERSHSSMIVIQINPSIQKNFQTLNTTIKNSLFGRNKNHQVIGLAAGSTYQGSLIRYINNGLDLKKYLPLLNLLENEFRENQFFGYSSSLISVINVLVKIQRCAFQKNGYIGKRNEISQEDDFNNSFNIESSVLYNKNYETFEWQEYGALAIYGTLSFAYPNYIHEIFNNTFELSASKIGTALFISINYQDIYLKSNIFRHLFAGVGGAVLYSEGSSQRSTILMEKSSISHIYSIETGSIFMQPSKPVQSLILRNSTFDHTYGSQGQAITVISCAKIFIENVNFTRTSFKQASLIEYVQSITNNNKVDIFDNNYLKDLGNTLLNPIRGLIDITSTNNQNNISFAGETFQNSFIQYSEIINCHFSNSKSSKHSVLSSYLSKIRIFNDPFGSTFNGFFGNIALDRGLIGAEGNSKIIGTNLVFRDNWSKNMASTFYSGSSEIILENCTFINNTANGVGSIVLESDSIFSCNYCKFINNKGNDSSTIFANSNQFTYFKISNSVFENNTSVANLINMFQSTGKFENVTFLNNIAFKVNNGITLISSQLTAKNITVRYDNQEYINRLSYDVDTGFFNLNYRSSLSMVNAKFTNCRGAIAGVLYATGSSRVEISEGTLIESSFSKKGDTIHLSLAESIKVSGAVFRDNRHTDLYIEQTYAKIQNSVFTRTVAESIQVQSSNIEIINNTFQDGINYNVDGKAINCKCLNGSIINNTFRALSSARGGAIYLSSDVSQGFISALTIERNKFIDNHAQHGGAIYINDVVQLKIANNYFSRNKASIIDPPSALTKIIQSKGYGGAIYYTCLNDAMKAQDIQCQVTISESNAFKDNMAQNDGGAILWVTYPFIDDGTNQFNNNSANYGEDIATFPQSLLVEFLDNGDYLEPFKKEPNKNLTQKHQHNQWLRRQLLISNTNLSTIPILAPGTPFSFYAYILDQNGNVYKTDSQSKAILKAKSSSNVTSIDKQRVLVYNEEAVAQEGIFKFVNATVMAFPGSSVSLKLEIQGIQTFGNSLSFLEQPLQLNVSLRKCVSGEQLQADFSCKACSPGTYLYEIPEKEMYCKECKKHAVCFGRNLVAPQPEYWRSTNTSENFMKCLNPKMCLGGNETNPTGNCAEGYEGILCQQCKENYYKSEQFKCSKCPDSLLNVIQIVLVLVAAIIIVVLFVRSSLNSATKKKPLYSVYLRIFANHIQIVGAISNIDYNWPEEIQQFQDGKQQISSTADRLFSFDCLLMNTVKLNSDGSVSDNFPIYYQKLLFFGFLPLLLALLDFAFWLIYCTFKERNYTQLKSKFISTLVVLFFLVHPTITKAMFLQLNCMYVDEDLRLQANLESICYKGHHMFFLLAIVVPSILIWTLGILIFVIVLLAKNKKTFSLMQNNEVAQEEYDAIMILKIKYGFLFSGYGTQTFYWEIVIMARKIIIIMATVFFSSFSTDLQVLLILLIIILSMFMQVKFAPYYTSTLNKMENYSLQVCAVTLYAGIFYVTGSHYNYMDNDGLNWFFFFSVIIPNVIFFFYWLYMIRIELLKEVYKLNKPIVFLMLSCMTQQSFQKKYMIQDDAIDNEQQIKIKSPSKELSLRKQDTADFSMIDVSQDSLFKKSPETHSDETIYPEGKLEMRNKKRKYTLQNQINLESIFNNPRKNTKKDLSNEVDINEIDLKFNHDDITTLQSQNDAHRMHRQQRKFTIQNLITGEISDDYNHANTARSSLSKVYPLESFRSNSKGTYIPSLFKPYNISKINTNQNTHQGFLTSRIESQEEVELEVINQVQIQRKSEPSSVRSQNSSSFKQGSTLDQVKNYEEEKKAQEPTLQENDYPKHTTPSSIEFESIEPIDEEEYDGSFLYQPLDTNKKLILAKSLKNKTSFQKLVDTEKSSRLKKQPVSFKLK